MSYQLVLHWVAINYYVLGIYGTTSDGKSGVDNNTTSSAIQERSYVIIYLENLKKLLCKSVGHLGVNPKIGEFSPQNGW